ncbi:MAG: SLC13 family permease, partial [Planctomycetota bacterium]
MGFDAVCTLLVLVATVVLLAIERLPAEVVAMLGFAALLATGVLSPADAYATFANPAALAVGAMFVVAAALERTGALEVIVRLLRRHPGRGERHLLLLVLPPVALLSAFLNNTAIVVLFTPVVIRLAREHGISPARVLMPLSFLAILGGTCTEIGTSTNLLVASVVSDHGLGRIGIFEFARAGLPLTVLGLLYSLTVGRRLLPDEPRLAPSWERKEPEYLSRLTVLDDSPWIGQRLSPEVSPLPAGASVLEIERDDSRLVDPLETVFLRPGDRIIIAAPAGVQEELRRLPGIRFEDRGEGLDALHRHREAIIFNAIVAPGSEIEGKTLGELGMRQRYGAVVLSLERHGRRIEGSIRDTPLAFGDAVSLLGTPESQDRIRLERQLVLLGDRTPYRRPRRERMPLAIAVLLAIVTGAALGWLPLPLLALMGAVVLVATGCLEPKEAYDSVRLSVLLLIFGMLGLGRALETTGLAEAAVHAAIAPLGGLGPQFGPIAVVSAIVLVTAIMTELVTNVAAAALVTPLAFAAAGDLGLAPIPLAMAVAYGASACFATPIGYQTNAFVYAAGGYRFRDFVRAG